MSVPLHNGLLVFLSTLDKGHDLLGKLVDDLDLSSTLSDSKVINLLEYAVSVSKSL